MSTTQNDVNPREILKQMDRDEFLKDHTRDEMETLAGILGMAEDTASGASNKGELYDLMVGLADLPDPSLRGTSEIDSPVAYVWQKAEEMFRTAAEDGAPEPRRKDVIQACVDDGVAYYTARTQYQSWFSATNKGERAISELAEDEVPAVLRPKDEEDADA